MQKGFTLIELLVVVLIIGVLVSMAIPQYERSVERARTAEVLSNGKIILDSMNRAIMLRPNVAPTVKSALDVKIGGGAWNEEGNIYKTKDFEYDISNGSFLLISRLDEDMLLYQVYMYNRLNLADEDVRLCIFYDKLGKFACELFGEHGYIVKKAE